MPSKPTLRRPTLIVLVGIFVLMAAASVPVFGAPPEPEPERSYYQPLLLDPQRRLAAPETNFAAAPEAPQTPSVGEGTSLSTYQHLTNDNWDILIRDGTSGLEIPIANSGYDEIQPRLRRGADRVAYISDMQDGFQLWTMNPDNTDKRRLTSGAESAYPNWSPDGTRIVFEREVVRDEVEIFVINADGSGLTQLTFSPGYDGMASWAPDGSHILFVSYRTGGYRIWRMNPDGSNPLQLNDIPYSMDPYYSPDGERIVFDSYSGGDFAQLWSMNADGSNPSMFYQVAYADCMVTGWSPDGTRILFTEIQWIIYNGQWYWTSAYVKGAEYRYYYVSNVDTYSQSGLDLNMSWQSFDNTAPELSLWPLRSESGSPLQLHVTGSDSGGSGLAKYAIQFRQAGGDWQELAGMTPIAEAPPEFIGAAGVSYEFRVRGMDNASNVEPWPATPDTASRIESQPPITAFIDPPSYYRGGIYLDYLASDPGGSRIAGYDTQQFNEDTQEWVMVAENTPDTEVYAWNAPGYTVKLRVRARDSAGNVEAWPEAGDAGYHEVTFYEGSIYGIAHANTGAPVPGVEVSPLMDTLIAHESSDLSGAYFSYFTDDIPSASYSKPGYGSLPYKVVDSPRSNWFDVYLPPADNLVQDGDLEQELTDPGSPWTVSGDYPFGSPLDPGECHTGKCVALSSPVESLTSPAEIFPISAGTIDPVASFGADGRLHIVGTAGQGFTYRQRTTTGDWLDAESISTPWGIVTNTKDIAGDSSGAAHLVYQLEYQLYYSRRAPGGGWSTPQVISGDEQSIYTTNSQNRLVQMDGTGGLHVIWQCNQDYLDTYLCYTYRSPEGNWSAVTRPAGQIPYNIKYRFELSSTGNFYVVWAPIYGEGVVSLLQRSPGGSWSGPIDLGMIDSYNNLFHLDLDAANLPVVHWYRQTQDGSCYLRARWMQPNGNWSAVNETFLVNQPNGILHLLWDIDIQGQAHILYGDYEGHQYAIWPRGGALETKPVLNSNWSDVYSFNLTQDGLLHLTSNQIVEGIKLITMLDGIISSSIDTSEVFGYEQPPIVTMDGGEIPHFIIPYYDNVNWTLQYFHFSLKRAAANESGEISQELSIPPDMNQAGLSFLYRLGGGQIEGDSGLSAWIDPGSGMQKLFQSLPISRGWEHAWVDLSAYAGQTITLSLRMNQAAGELRTYGYLDEVSLGTGYGDAWLGVDPADRTVSPGEAFELEVSYGNQGGFALPGAVIEVNLPLGLELLDPLASCAGGPPAYSCPLGDLAAGAQGSLSLSLRTTPAALFNQPLDLGLRLATSGDELEPLNNQLTVSITPANALYLPSIGTWWAGD